MEAVIGIAATAWALYLVYATIVVVQCQKSIADDAHQTAATLDNIEAMLLDELDKR